MASAKNKYNVLGGEVGWRDEDDYHYDNGDGYDDNSGNGHVDDDGHGNYSANDCRRCSFNLISAVRLIWIIFLNKIFQTP